jgi:hypothetical protein
MDAEHVRRIALSLPEAVEKSHFGKADFRVRDRIFATLPDQGRAVVKLTLEQQDIMCEAEPTIFRPVEGAWGRKGWTAVHLPAANEETLQSALTTAWRNVAPKSLQGRLD